MKRKREREREGERERVRERERLDYTGSVRMHACDLGQKSD